MTTPPSPFEALKNLAEQGDATQRAKDVGAALNTVPDLQRWLREIRQHAVQEMHQDGLTYDQIGTELGMHRVRAHQIAEGRTTGKRAKAEGEPVTEEA
ncbi:sigma-70 family RNA polymerase sigma factor [Streptomyces sp. ActVer]|uniref:sigma-70 family RNA polymerase sigma factor n=1 Tax=Streptomyces sp. ActVer TaxID=3014558 RepID=UPI0022B2F85B|nr:sigma-70 family RNA polymerase sigma factor [Streptomyces sp. ActVer]MCZ4510464.1 sigma-70 family RNA polymerase sigma factor [Streptomyces sp. ActVer]